MKTTRFKINPNSKTKHLTPPLGVGGLLIILLISNLLAFSQNEKAAKLLYSDNFNKGLCHWKAEFEQPSTSAIKIVDSKLDVQTSRGATVWFKHKLKGNIRICYDAVVVDAGGANDRVSDLNAFWMATDPATVNLFTRDGKFESYNNLNLYYAGVGGHTNKFTRFRKYHAKGDKPVLKECTDAAHLLVGNKTYSVKIEVFNGTVRYFLNNQLFWEYFDNAPYTQGYFGFRTTISHQQFSNFKVFVL